MQRIVIDKPYVPVLPYRGRLWPRVLLPAVPWFLHRKFGISQVDVSGAERLAESLRAGHGIMLAANHCRDCDPIVLGMLSRQVRRPFFVMASWHVFQQGWMQAFLLRRAGAFSIYREGLDRGAVNTAIDILEQGRRPLVIFPEGVVSRTNDRLNSLMDGAALIARTAAKHREKRGGGKVVVHPIAIRYHFHGRLASALEPVLDEIEQRLTWPIQQHQSLAERIVRIGSGLLALKEIEYFGEAQQGTIAERLGNLIDHILSPIEKEWTPESSDGTVVSRVKRIRSAIVPDLVKGDIDEKERKRRWRQLADVYLAQQLSNYPPDYIQSNPTAERLLETVERFEEDLTDRIAICRPMTASVSVGKAIEVRAVREHGANDSLMQSMEQEITGLLNIHETSDETAVIAG